MQMLNELCENKAVAKEILRATSPQEIFEILKANGYEDDYEEFSEHVRKLKETYDKKRSGLLTEADMDDLLENTSSDQMLGTIFFLFIPFAA